MISIPFLTRYALLQILILSLLTYVLVRLAIRYRTKQYHAQLARSLGCKPPREWKNRDPLLGLDLLYEQYVALKSGHLMDTMSGWLDKLGCRTANFSLMGLNIISTTEPANLRTCLATNFSSWELPEGRKTELAHFLGDGIFTTDGEAWKHSREMLRPSFARNRIVAVRDNLEKHCQRLISCVAACKAGETIDLQPLFFAFTMDVATEFLFGECSDELVRLRRKVGATGPAEGGDGSRGDVGMIADNGDVSMEEFVDAFTYAQSAMELAADEDEQTWLGFLRHFLPNRKLKRCVKVVHRYVDSIVARGLATHDAYQSNKPEHPLFLHEVISQTRNPLKLRAELLNTLLASRDTTASLLSNVWFELARRPKVWSRLQREITTTLAASTNQPPTYEELKSFKYLTALLKESLRLYPIVPANSRQAASNTTLPVGGGEDEKSPIFVPKGALMQWNLWQMHRRRDLYGEDAEEFKPERWLDCFDDDDDDDGDDDEKNKEISTRSNRKNNKGLRVSWEFLPFNGGPRICLGQQFALTEASYLTVRLMQTFDQIESRDEADGKWVERIGLTMTGKGGAKVMLRARKGSTSR